jgi:septal ring factor EnvC (AmiA/AmiB activator)
MQTATERSAKLKTLQTERGRVTGDAAEARKAIGELGRKVAALDKRLQEIDREIEKLKVKELIVSEHAMLRFVSRVLGFDVSQIQEAILTDKLRGWVESCGNGSYPLTFQDKQFRVKVKDGVVVTVITDDAKDAAA